jgi:hypothetical protein
MMASLAQADVTLSLRASIARLQPKRCQSSHQYSCVCLADSTAGKGQQIWAYQVAASTLSGAFLGPFCDSLHSAHDVLHYTSPTIVTPIETCWWVPLLFGVAGCILGVSVPLLDTLLSSTWTKPPQRTGMRPFCLCKMFITWSSVTCTPCTCEAARNSTCACMYTKKLAAVVAELMRQCTTPD